MPVIRFLFIIQKLYIRRKENYVKIIFSNSISITFEVFENVF